MSISWYTLSDTQWLVLEPWITPSLFEATGNDAIVDEYTYGQMQDYNRAKNALTNHWNSWITEDDFRQIAGGCLQSTDGLVAKGVAAALRTQD